MHECVFCCIFARRMNKSGSNRVYSREIDANGNSVIRVIGTNRAENHAFITLARHFHAKGLPVPEVYTVSDDEMQYTQQDLGDTLLYDAIAAGRECGNYSEAEILLLEKTIRALAHIQIEGAQGLDWSVCFPVPEFDQRSIMWDLNYFKYCFLKLTGIEIDEPKLEDDFETMVKRLLCQQSNTFLYRDFQARNVMIYNGEPYFIDFQGGRRGPIYYDLASFLWQAKARYPQSLRNHLINTYLDELKQISNLKSQISNLKSQITTALPHFVLFRTLQVLGAYGYRGLFERKQHFIESLPFAKANLKELFADNDNLIQDYPYIYAISNNI